MPLTPSRFARVPTVADDLPVRSPDDMGPTLLNLLKKSSASDVMDVADVLHAAGRLDPLAVNRDGDHFLAAWMKQAKPSYGENPDFPDQAALQRFDRWSDGQVWTQANRQGRTPLDLWINAFHTDGRVDAYHASKDEDLAFVLSKMPVERLRQWTLSSALSPSDASKSTWQGTGLVPYLVVRSAVKALDVLFRQGFTLLDNINGNEARPVAMLIRHPALWQTFLAQGGDPTRTVQHQDNTMALWERLRDEVDSSYSADSTQRALMADLKTQVQDWVGRNAGSALAEREMRDYWKGFGAAHREVAKHMKSRADWPTLQDEQGRSAMMRLVQRDPNAVKAFLDVQKSRTGAALRDHEGHTLWSFMLAHGASDAASLSAQKWLAANVPPEPDHAGQGLVWQTLLLEWNGKSPALSTSPGQVLPVKWAPAVWEKTAQHQTFWWGDEACQQALASWITDTLSLGQRHATKSSSASTNRLAQALAGIVDNTELQGLHPHLLGALVACELFEFGMEPDKIQRLNRLVDAGALLRIPEARREHLVDRHQRSLAGEVQLNPAVQGILGRLEGNELRAMPLGAEAPAPTRTRGRL